MPIPTGMQERINQIHAEYTARQFATALPQQEWTARAHAGIAAAQLKATGRVTDHKLNANGELEIVYNTPNVVDRTRMRSYDKDTDTLTIRVEHSAFPEFWVDVELPFAKFREWVKSQE
jgi:hypothetical protein